MNFMKPFLNLLKWPFTYWWNFILEFRLWLYFQYTTKQNREVLEENELRVDWIGRVYGVINVPDEVLGAAEEIQQAYVLKQMGKYGGIMNKLNLSNIVYPQMSEIQGTGAYLVIFWPVLDRLNWLILLGSILGTFIYFSIIYILIRILIKYDILTSIWDFLVNIV